MKTTIQNNQTKSKFSKKLKNISFLSLFIVIASYNHFGYAATYYVDAAAGNDSFTGTSVSPLKTIQRAANIVHPGDTVIVKNGTYTTSNSTLVDINYGGGPGYPVTFKAENSGGAKLSAGSNRSQFAWIIEPGVSYVNIQGFEMYGFSNMGILSRGTNIGITGNHIHDIGRVCTDTSNGLNGIYLDRANASVSITNNIIHDVGRYAPGENGCQPTTSYYQNHDHGIYIDGAQGVKIQSNTFYNLNRGYSIQLYSGSGYLPTGINILSNNFSYPNPYRDGHIAIANPGLTSSTVAYNTFTQPRNQALSFTSGIKLSGVSATQNATYTAVISLSKPSGVTFSGNTDYK
jgi:hypothetical protein